MAFYNLAFWIGPSNPACQIGHKLRFWYYFSTIKACTKSSKKVVFTSIKAWSTQKICIFSTIKTWKISNILYWIMLRLQGTKCNCCKPKIYNMLAWFAAIYFSSQLEWNQLNLTQKQKKNQMAFPLVFDAVFAITFFHHDHFSNKYLRNLNFLN